jgi:Domain of unknown function (DUF5076)
MAKPEVHTLPVPPFVQEGGGTEVLRAFVDSGNGLSVMFQRAFETPETWGILLVDVARHVARGYAEGDALKERAAMAEIRRLFDAEWKRSTDLGETNVANN